MTNQEKIAIANKRVADLKCLGIKPDLYFSVAKYLNFIAYVVVKDTCGFIFYNKEYSSDKKKGSVTKSELLDIVCETFGIHTDMIEDIINEWYRERKIMYNMSQEAKEYWDYLSLPTKPIVTEESYNF